MVDMNEAQERLLGEFANVAFDRLAKGGYTELDALDRAVICVWSLVGEVDNGGFDQYYFNTPGDWAFDTPNVLRTIGASHTAAIMERGNALFGDAGPSQDRSIRQVQLDALPEFAQTTLELLDDEFFQYTDDLFSLLATYVASLKPAEGE